MFGCIVIFCILLGKDRFHKENLLLLWMHISATLLLFGDSVAWSLEGVPGLLVHALVKMGYFMPYCMGYVTIIGLAYYVQYKMDPEQRNTSLWVACTVIICAFGITGAVMSLWNGFYFEVSDENVYSRSYGYIVNQVLDIGAMVIVAVRVITAGKALSLLQKCTFLSYMVFPFIAIIVQAVTGAMSLSNVALMFAMILMFATSRVEQIEIIVNQEREMNQMQQNIMISQIQPHFLYNVLNTIYYLCDKDSNLAKQAIGDFSDYLRMNMDSLKHEKPIAFRQELSHVMTYLRLEKMRFEEELNVEYDILIEDFFLPGLTIQPLVENAVKHGVGKKDGGGTVKVGSYRANGSIFIYVKDDGVGFDPDHMPNNDKGRSHIGISNVKSRLKNMMSAKLTITSTPGEGTYCLVELPMDRALVDPELENIGIPTLEK